MFFSGSQLMETPVMADQQKFTLTNTVRTLEDVKRISLVQRPIREDSKREKEKKKSE